MNRTHTDRIWTLLMFVSSSAIIAKNPCLSMDSLIQLTNWQSTTLDMASKMPVMVDDDESVSFRGLPEKNLLIRPDKSVLESKSISGFQFVV
ncbi:hypothetical protein Bpfe_002579 [Biomphalaria pfeifferi]|uniref:Uncharacterized protein n=1 Tax=Biomphalaria pfeifferi TaxID=112525 RepID=A0AAD8C7Y4_BIOPF|nr:hypothetical protein Bpfe_002579 [Biomphalaria pfeifferi]